MRLLNYLFVPLLSLAVALAVVSVILVPDDRVLAQESGGEDLYGGGAYDCSGCITCNTDPPPCSGHRCGPVGPRCDILCGCTSYGTRCRCQ